MFCRFYQAIIVFFQSLFQLIGISNISLFVPKALKYINVKHKSIESGPPFGRASLKNIGNIFERVMGIEPTSSGWKPDIISQYTTPAYASLRSHAATGYGRRSAGRPAPAKQLYNFLLQTFSVGEPGIEPGLNAPKALVLPLYYSPL